MDYHFRYCLYIAAVLSLCFICTYASPDETKLMQNLFYDYGRNSRPSANESQPVVVTAGFTLLQILNFQQFEQVITLTGWLQLNWQDYRLQWNPEEYGNIKSISMSPDSVWCPDIVMYNAIQVEPSFPVHVSVQHTGKIIFVETNKYTVSCITTPEDTDPSCQLKFGSWTTDSSQIDLKTETDIIVADFYIQHHSWELITTSAKRIEKEYDAMPNTKYVNVIFTFDLEKRKEETDQDEDNLNTASHLNVHIMMMFPCFTTLLLLFGKL